MTLGGMTAALMVIAVWAHHARRLTWPDNT
ncbi:hypothetical protein QF032_007696 [Streptomyces achromogenes]|nr:hypothetical protein [Streptomyces achromogenes]